MICSGFEVVQYDSYELSSGDNKENHVFYALNKRSNVKVPSLTRLPILIKNKQYNTYECECNRFHNK